MMREGEVGNWGGRRGVVCMCVCEITKEMTVVNIRMNYEGKFVFGKFGFVYEIFQKTRHSSFHGER